MSDDKPFSDAETLRERLGAVEEMGETPCSARCFTALRLRTLEKEVTALPR
jgi:hypothetical protein